MNSYDLTPMQYKILRAIKNRGYCTGVESGLEYGISDYLFPSGKVVNPFGLCAMELYELKSGNEVSQVEKCTLSYAYGVMYRDYVEVLEQIEI